MADSDKPFGFGPGEFDEFAREAGENLRAMLGKFVVSQGGRDAWMSMFDDAKRRPRPTPQPETTGETGSGVWAVFVIDNDGGARVEQVFASELDALRAHQHNTDTGRKVRFLPYGIAVSALES
ncbi:hypothetical protein [Gordonia sp. CPCC 205333]|uniref:hypothetical protein n=1 Tax=Gordonia sp. CPCC 205333 TaxID=3140790 RepID=UPI003AF3757E